MNTVLRIGLGIAVASALVVVGLAAGWALWGRQLWTGWGYGMGPGMMGRWGAPAAPSSGSGWGCGSGPGGTTSLSGTLTIEEAHEAVERYVAALGYPDLEIAELMEFERNFYAIVREADTGIGAMELLVDKWTGIVSPEVGPNMMWNARYGPALSLPNGMHGRGGRMMGGASESNSVTPEEAIEIAQRWLDAYRPGVTVEEHADPFYGYYTIHTLKDGEIEGMLSVHGTTGQVWYHTWHGSFVQMIEEEDEGNH
jgi:hypothetical protein